MEVKELLKALEKYGDKIGDKLLEFQIYSDGSGYIANQSGELILRFDTAEDALQQIFPCKECDCKGTIEVDTFYTLRDEYGRETIIGEEGTDTCEKCKGTGYIIPK